MPTPKKPITQRSQLLTTYQQLLQRYADKLLAGSTMNTDEINTLNTIRDGVSLAVALKELDV